MMNTNMKDSPVFLFLAVVFMIVIILALMNHYAATPDTAMHNEQYECVCNCPPQPCQK